MVCYLYCCLLVGLVGLVIVLCGCLFTLLGSMLVWFVCLCCLWWAFGGCWGLLLVCWLCCWFDCSVLCGCCGDFTFPLGMVDDVVCFVGGDLVGLIVLGTLILIMYSGCCGFSELLVCC